MNNMGCMQVVYASENKGEDYEVINIYDAETVGEDAESDPVIITQIILDNIQFTEYHIAEKLIEWKFDIFNLIGKGEAIDVNTLQTNPYK